MRALLFDVDDVLIDSYAGYRMVWNRWSESRGLDAELVWAATHGRRPVDTIADVAPHLDASMEYAALRALLTHPWAFYARLNGRTPLSV